MPLSFGRKALKLFHPEAMPRLGAVLYDVISGTRVFQYHYDLVARDIASVCTDGSLLDVGTGPGRLLHGIHREVPKLRLVGLDASPAMVARARAHAAASGLADLVEIREGNATSMPFPDACFDVVVSTGSLHHWKSPSDALNEVHRVLKPDGYALMYDLVSDTPESIVREIRRRFGGLRTTLFWLHSLEEPFYDHASLETLAGPTLFHTGRTRWIGLLCCLILEKGRSS